MVQSLLRPHASNLTTVGLQLVDDGRVSGGAIRIFVSEHMPIEAGHVMRGNYHVPCCTTIFQAQCYRTHAVERQMRVFFLVFLALSVGKMMDGSVVR